MEMTDFTWQHQKYSRPEIYVVTLVLLRLYTGRTSKHFEYDYAKNVKLSYGNVRFQLATAEIF